MTLKSRKRVVVRADDNGESVSVFLDDPAWSGAFPTLTQSDAIELGEALRLVTSPISALSSSLSCRAAIDE